jgi:hypothetical protein
VNLHPGPPTGLGWLIALVVLILAIGFWAFGHGLDRDWLLGFIAALALARLL